MAARTIESTESSCTSRVAFFFFFAPSLRCCCENLGDLAAVSLSVPGIANRRIVTQVESPAL